MDSIGAVYAKVPAGGVSALDAAVREARGIGRNSSPLGVLAFDPAVHSFALVDRWGRPDDMPHWAEDPDPGLAVELAALSRMVGEVIALYEVDEGTTMGIYLAWRDGVLVRNLQWAADQWQCVEGEPQPWEATLFDPEALHTALKRADDKEQCRAMFDAGRIVRGASWPGPERISRNIRTVNPAPDFGFAPWPRRKELEERNREPDRAVRESAAAAPSRAPASSPAPAAVPVAPPAPDSIRSAAPDEVAEKMFAPLGELVRGLSARARSAMAAGRLDQAMADFEELMKISPLSGEGVLGKAAVLIRLKRDQEALAWLEELSARRDLDPLRSFMTAVVADRIGDAVKAEKLFSRLKDSAELSPEKRAVAAARAGDLALSRAVRVTAIDDAVARIPDLADAVVAYERFSLQNPDLTEPICEGGVCLSLLGRPDEALAWFDRAIALDAAFAIAYDYKAVTQLRLERFEAAVQTLDEGLRNCPKSGRLLTRRGIALTKCGRYAEAVAVLELSITQDPGKVEAWAYKGDAEFRLGDPAAAIASIRHFLDLRFVDKEPKVVDAARRQLWALENPDRVRYPDHGVACLEASLAAELAGHHQDALALLDEGLAADPLSGKLWFNRGALLRALSRFEEALACFERAEALLGPGLVLEAQIDVLLAMDRVEGALDCHERALAQDPANAFALRAKAATLARLGRYPEACAIYQRLVSRHPREHNVLVEYSAVRAKITEMPKIGDVRKL
jgi:tetratricopeptide (TPR) repeat protein